MGRDYYCQFWMTTLGQHIDTFLNMCFLPTISVNKEQVENEQYLIKNDIAKSIYVSRKKKKKRLYFGTCLASAFARSLVVSVLPVPAGPSGAPPRFNFKAPINVLCKQEHSQ